MGSFHDPADEAENEELYRAFIKAHETRLRSLAIPECKWRTLCRKLTYSIFDAGENFMYVELSSEDNEFITSRQPRLHVYTDHDMNPEDEEHIYIIDHAWTYTLQTARTTLEENPSLVQRMASLMEISDINDDEDVIASLLNKMWLFNNCYVVHSGDRTSPTISCWYILDEFGSRIHYSETPNFHLVPFYFDGDQSMYSVLFPRTAVEEREEITVPYPGYNTSLSDAMKKALEFPWNHCDLSHIDFSLIEPSVDYFASGRYEDILPDASFSNSVPVVPPGQRLKVFSEYSDIAEFLTCPSFEVTEDKQQAEIFWLAQRQYNIREFTEVYVNFHYLSQFPSEHVLINKDLLAIICRRCATCSFNCDTLESNPEWLPTTFNLKTELHKFISYFQHRERRNLDNVWICKPFNLARGLDIHVTDNINKIIRLSGTRSMVACKYITDPVLFPVEGKGLVKMDLRYIVLLRSCDPLEVYVYNRFWIRFANKPFELDDFNDYEKHFTVMNYSNFPLQQMYCQDFIQKFEDHYMSYKWSDIQEAINKMIKDIFTAATMKEAPAGIGKFNGSRAMYGLDVMLRWDRESNTPKIVPMIIEVNWMPDCKRACQYYPEFYNDVFSVLFLGNTKDKHVVKL